MALIDFTLSNAIRFYSSMGNPLGGKGLITLRSSPAFILIRLVTRTTDLHYLQVQAMTI